MLWYFSISHTVLMRQFIIVCTFNLDLRVKVVFISAIFGAALGRVGKGMCFKGGSGKD